MKEQSLVIESLIVDLIEIFLDANIAYQYAELKVSSTEMFWRMILAIILMRVMALMAYHIIHTINNPKVED